MNTIARSIPALVLIAVLVGAVGAALTQERTTTHTVIREGTVYKVFGNVLILRIPGEGYKKFTVPSDFTLNAGGREMTIHDLKPGMRLARVDIVHFSEGAESMTVEQVESYEPEAEEVATAVIVAEVHEEPEPVPEPEPEPEPAPVVLPKTAGPLPLIAMAGLTLVGIAAGVSLARKRR